jgi:hypothetical protein
VSIAPPESRRSTWLVHPAAELFPLLPDAELAELAEDIRIRGLVEAVWLYDDPERGTVLLDGRNRARACEITGVPVQTRTYTGTDPIGFSIAQNLKRRHLTTGQKAAVAYEAAPLFEAEARLRKAEAAAEENRRRAAERRSAEQTASAPTSEQPARPVVADRPQPGASVPATPAPKSRDRAAEVAGTSGRSVGRYKRIADQVPELAAKVRSGELALDAAEKKLRHRQRVEARRAEDLERQQAAAQPGAATIVHADCMEWLAGAPDADLLLTDPPYTTDVDDIGAFAHGWLPLALAKVKPTGRAYVCIGAYPDELLAYLSVPAPPGMALADVLVWTYRNTIGPSSKLDYSRNWQAILHYRGPEAPPLRTTSLTEKFAVIDMNAPDGRRGERWHTWQKPDELGEMLVNHATLPGAVVLDPFAGTGTFLLAAARLGRTGHGVDQDPDMVRIAKERGCE